ncbi:MAG: hypothetical protein ABGU93_13630 [Acetobacterium sp.]|uniref:hypothetical protein n=1 Tax=Acetobacterium sp. TaxID=1872094 RepID=UPI003242833F
MSKIMTDVDGNKDKSLNQDQFTVKTLYMRGIPKWEFERYLTHKAETIDGNRYAGPDWQVSLSEERQESIGVCSLVAVDVTLAVAKDQFDDFLLTFRKNFLRGGG